ncbi:MAG TPA: tail fiber domain-containing protein [Saprospiraceae bacterium]
MKKNLVLISFCLLACLHVGAQSVGIGTTTPDASAQLDISNTSKGILIPRMNTASVLSIVNPAKGLMVYDTSKNELMVNMGTSGSPDWRSIAYNSAWSMKGNAGTNPSTHFIGTIDNAPLFFRIRNKQAGKIDSVSGHTFYGYKAGINTANTAPLNTAIGNNAFASNATGHYNTAVGAYALHNNTTGIMNSAFGVNALKENTTANFCVAFGLDALEHNSGNSNSAFGNSTLKWNTIGFANTALGSGALALNSTGSLNVATGRVAMFSNTTGFNNVAMGAESLNRNTTGFYNAALGDGSLYANTVGFANTACGSGALYNTTVSSYNTTLGYHAGFSFNLGWNNTLIGADCNFIEGDLFNSVALGHNVTITASNQARIGNSSTTSIGGYTNWTNISDGRYKKNVRENVSGLDFIMKLRPITYQLDVTNLAAKLNESSEHRETSGMAIAMADKESMIQSGFIAQEVEQAANALGFEFSGVDKPKNQEDLYGLRYAEFVVPLVKATQELQQQVQELQLQLADLKTKLNNK